MRDSSVVRGTTVQDLSSKALDIIIDTEWADDKHLHCISCRLNTCRYLIFFTLSPCAKLHMHSALYLLKHIDHRLNKERSRAHSGGP